MVVCERTDDHRPDDGANQDAHDEDKVLDTVLGHDRADAAEHGDDGHLQQHAEGVADAVGREVAERLGAVPACFVVLRDFLGFL